jgi:diguanylate cyclase (GGDEF)-like protein
MGGVGADMAGEYDLRLVALSLVVAAFASYAALELAGRVSAREGKTSWLWLLGGAFAMGTGIWSMHFIGMLAFSLPVRIAYDISINALSWFIAMAVSGIALFVVRRPAPTKRNLTVGATLMGVGISSMHYTGMASMRMSPPIQYDPPLFILSVIIAIVASLAALWIAFQLRKRYSVVAILAKLGSALVMGLAITGMHYTGMAAAHFAPDSLCLAVDSTGGLDNATLAVLIGFATLSVLTITLVISAVDAHYHAQTASLADSLQAANEQLRTVALYDGLTGLPNRSLLEDRLGQAMNRANRGRRPCAVMFVDLDKFKPVNDNFGHGVGDELLKTVAKRLTGCVRKSDTVARTGGDEFVIVLNEIWSVNDVAMVSKKVLDELSRPVFIGRHELDISCSIGISVYPDDGKDMNTLIMNADMAMYHAKKSGRNNFRFFIPEMSATAQYGAQ